MKLVENLALFGSRRSGHGAFQSAKSLRLGKQSATTAAAMTSRDHDLGATWRDRRDLGATWARPGCDLDAAVGCALVVVPRHRFLRDTLIFHGRFYPHAGTELIDHAALVLLPWCLAWRILIAAVLFQRCAARGQFVRRNEHIGGAFVQIDSHAIAGLKECETAARPPFRRGVEDRRRTGGPRLPAVAHAGKPGVTPFLQRP